MRSETAEVIAKKSPDVKVSKIAGKAVSKTRSKTPTRKPVAAKSPTKQTERENLIQAIYDLPAESLLEIAKYVEFLRFKQSESLPVANEPTSKRKHAAEGIWADRTDIIDGASFSLELRRRIENREDGKLFD